MDKATEAHESGNYTLAVELFSEALKGYQDQKGDVAIIKASLNLTDCYLTLHLPEKAYETLEPIWHPRSPLAIDTTHALFVRMSHLYFRVQKDLEGKTQENAYVSLFSTISLASELMTRDYPYLFDKPGFSRG